MGKRIKCGVAGVGYLGQHHARIYSELEGCELVGVCDPNDECAERVVREHGCKRFKTIEELGAACDAVSVVVPTDKHFEVAMPLLEAGTHLLIEKPICPSLEEARKIVETAKASNRIVQVGHVENYNPVTDFLETAANNPRYITADRLAPFNLRGTEVGVVLDLMIHDIGVILQLVKSPIKDIQAVGVNVILKTEDIANARITFENGAVANLNTSRVSLKKVREIRVFQPSAYLSMDFMNQKGHLIKMNGLSLDKQDIPIQKDQPLKIELESFVRCIGQAQEPKVSATLGTSALEVATQVTEIIQEGIRQAKETHGLELTNS